MRELIVGPTQEGLVAAALSQMRIVLDSTPGQLSLGLAGGSTPLPLYRSLAAARYWPWSRTTVFFGDERCVPADHADSNYRAAKEALLDRVHPATVLRVPAEMDDREAAASRYEETLSRTIGPTPDLLLLGMGGDGHTASLFPGRTVPWNRDVIAAPPPVDAPHARISVTESFIARCHQVIILVTGASKADRLAEVLAGGELPLARVLAARAGKPTFILADAAAAARVDTKE
ncbi:MAG: 6-phosphogluconolactonase [Myxococcota bacterium]